MAGGDDDPALGRHMLRSGANRSGPGAHSAGQSVPARQPSWSCPAAPGPACLPAAPGLPAWGHPRGLPAVLPCCSWGSAEPGVTPGPVCRAPMLLRLSSLAVPLHATPSRASACLPAFFAVLPRFAS
ncbi:hypothetical protein PAPYR_9213 [Paratrimastix pyriformis]|uniref:Uncharacterized protein n=1 Tax=Paratrimastix pyriformis TaxID=342808 RepID=A0ABQ8U8Z4_9EUKA|nr:hypothetical protein PAPYR_9213 [Paratrimastix pyriformis]